MVTRPIALAAREVTAEVNPSWVEAQMIIVPVRTEIPLNKVAERDNWSVVPSRRCFNWRTQTRDRVKKLMILAMERMRRSRTAMKES